jgi:deoxyribodipyrimidine photo-lyase
MWTGWLEEREQGNRRGCVVTARGGRVLDDGRVTSIFWYRRDLRVHDLPGLQAAVREGPILPLFVLDDRLLHGRWPSANRVWFMLESLKVLDQQLQERGASLRVRRGRPEEVVPALALEAGAEAVFVSRDYSPYARWRDERVADALADRGIAFHAWPGTLVHEPEEVHTDAGQPYAVFGPFFRKWRQIPRRAVSGSPASIETVAGVDPGRLPAIGEFGFEEIAPGTIAAGELAARERLDAWAGGGIAGYASHRDFPSKGATSRLSQDLRWGLVSPVEVVERCGGYAADSEKLIAEIAWREFSYHLLWHYPRIVREPFQRRFGGIAWDNDAERLEAWRAGRTGYPIVDAGMRELLATGYMHNRVRMICASFLAKDLLVDWRVGAAYFMEHLVDGDVANNTVGWQWAASVGADAQPYFRVFNPRAQGERFDPGGDYTRRWVPELANVPGEYIHEPGRMPADVQQAAGCRIGVDYPEPIVDHGMARERALAMFAAASKQPGAR